MAAMVLTPTTESIPPGEYVPTADRRIVLRDMTWADFRALVTMLGDRPVPRKAYLDGVIELMSPSRGHEGMGSNLGRLIEAFCVDRQILLTPYRSWLLDDESEEAGAEPDECYIFGAAPRTKTRPDLVIEVVWTSGGLNKLEIYKRLEISEVWFWKRDSISVHVLGSSGYTSQSRSARLPDLDLELLCKHASVEPLNEALRLFREAMRLLHLE
jgi:Uma2 family endonuclease